MKTPETQGIEDARALFLAAHARQQRKAALVALLTLVAIYVLPELAPSPYDGVMRIVGAAASFSACVALFPQSLRSRSGSLAPALCLSAALWVAAIVVTVLSLLGEIS